MSHLAHFQADESPSNYLIAAHTGSRNIGCRKISRGIGSLSANEEYACQLRWSLCELTAVMRHQRGRTAGKRVAVDAATDEGPNVAKRSAASTCRVGRLAVGKNISITA
jgi:hypothetical protein